MRLFRSFISLFYVLAVFESAGQSKIEWQNVDSKYGPLPQNIRVYFSDARLDSLPFKAYYVIADIKDKSLSYTTDTTLKRRFTPTQFFNRNNHPVVIVNGTFFSFETNQNLNVVIKNGKAVSFNRKTFRKKGDSITTYPVYNSAIGISNNRKADVAWIKTDSTEPTVKAAQRPITSTGNLFDKKKKADTVGVQIKSPDNLFKTWKMETAIGGGPVLVQDGQIKITNDEERMFMGKAIHDKHPRTAMGYTTDNKLIILVVEGRNPQASGASLIQLAQILKDLGCVEALNLDGGGSSCLLINGKETIQPSDKTGQRPVPAVFIIHQQK